MAADWIQWTKGLATKREVVIMAARLGIDPHELAGRIMRVWEWCDDNIPDDDFDPKSYDAFVILGPNPFPFLDSLHGLPGVAEAMAAPDIGWIITRHGNRCVFPRLGRHNGTTAKTRGLATKRKQRERARGDDPGENIVTLPSHADRDKKTTRGEERIEESSSFLKFKKQKKKKAREPADTALRLAEIAASVAHLEAKPP